MQKYMIILMSLWLVGCAGLEQPAIVIGTGAQPAAAMQALPMASGTPSPTGTSSPTASPTAIDWGSVWITQTGVALNQETINQEAQKLGLGLTQVWMDGKNRDGTSTAAVETATQKAAETQTPEAWALATVIAGKTATPEAIQNEKDAATVENIQITNRWMPIIFGAILLMIVLAGILVMAFLRAGIRAKQAERALYAKQAHFNNSPEPQAAPMAMKLDHRDEYGFGSVDFTTCPIEKKTLHDVATLIVEHGARYTQEQMTGAGKPLVKDGNYDTFGDWMVRNKIAMRFEDGRYKIEHPEFFKQVLNQ